MSDRNKEKQKRKVRQTWRPLGQLIKKTKLPYVGILLCVAASLLVAQLNLMFPSYTEQIMAGDFTTRIITATIAVLIAGAFADAIYQSLCLIIKGLISKRFRSSVWEKVLRLPVSNYSEDGTSEIISRVTEDTTKLSDFFTDDVAGLISNIYTLVGTTVILFSYDWHLVLAEGIIIPIIIIIGIIKGRVDFKWNNILQLRIAELTAGIAEILTNIPLIKTFGQEKKATEQSKEMTGELYKTKMTMTWISNGFSSISTLLTVAESLIVIFFGIYLIRRDIITVSVWVAFYMYSTNLSGGVDTLMIIWDDLKVAQGAMRRISMLACTDEDPYDTGEELTCSGEDISFEHVSFSYEDNVVIKDLSFTVPHGKTTAIVGMSGAGKSTIMNLLERFYEPAEGRICYGGRDIRDFTLRSWRQSIGYVAQNAGLIDGTVRDNLLYTLDEPISDEDLMAKLASVGMAELPGELEKGLDTEVGEGGCNLSGGQRQRIAIARALLNPPEIILLDEVTSNLDACAEENTETALGKLLEGRTVITVTHKLHSAQHADNIILLDDGQKLESGTYSKLMEDGGLFRALRDEQTKAGGLA
jgi:ATP-binding cassette, subfamily B, bacterial AbcA/BmrA